MKAAALRGALSDRARAGRIHVVEALVEGDKPSTKAAVEALTDLSGTRRQLVVLERDDALTWLSLRNVAACTCSPSTSSTPTTCCSPTTWSSPRAPTRRS